MKKIFTYLLLIPFMSFSQLPQTNLDFRWVGTTDASYNLIDSLTGSANTNFRLLNYSGDTNITYLTSKDTIQILLYETDTVPITVLFQNYNRADTLYFEMLDQTLGANDVETLPYRLNSIAHYSTPTDANAYFNTPSQAVSGLRTVGVNKTYPTIQAASNASVVDDTIEVYSGIYWEDFNGSSIRYLFMSGKTLTIQCVGDVDIRSIATNIVISIPTSTITINNAVINGEGVTANGINMSTAPSSLTLNRCKLFNVITNNIQTTSTAHTVNINKSHTKGGGFSFRDGDYIKESFIEVGANYFDSLDFTYNRTNAIMSVQAVGIKCNFNDIITSVNWMTTGPPGSLKYIEFNYNTFEFEDISGNASSTAMMTTTDEKFFITAIGNTCTSLETEDFTSPAYYFNLENNDGIFQDNTFLSETKTLFYHIFISATGVTKNLDVEVLNNLFDNNTKNGFSLTLGSEVSIDSVFSGSKINGNYFIGIYKDFPNETGVTAHHMLINSGQNFEIMYNFLQWCNLSIVLKTNGLPNQSGGIAYNLFQNNFRDIWIRGVQDYGIWNNTTFRSNLFNEFPIVIDENSAIPGDFSERITCTNNIFYCDTSSAVISIDQHAADSNTLFTNNIIYNNKGTVLAQIGLTNYTDSATLEATANFSGNYYSDPIFTSTNELWPKLPSVAINNGVNLGNSKSQGLNISTAWPDSIALKNQGNIWDMGSYVIGLKNILIHLNKILIFNDSILVID